MPYDIAAKVLIEKCRHEILRHFVGIPVTESVLIEELPQETVSLRRSDFPLLVTDEAGRQLLVLIEIQSRWEPHFPLRLLEYRCRHMLRRRLEAITCVLLLRPSVVATDRYEDNEVRYRYRLVRVYEWEAAEVMREPVVCLLPFVPLMKHGLELAETADRLLYESDLAVEDKADMLTTMAILAGLVSDRLPVELIARRHAVESQVRTLTFG